MNTANASKPTLTLKCFTKKPTLTVVPKAEVHDKQNIVDAPPAAPPKKPPKPALTVDQKRQRRRDARAWLAETFPAAFGHGLRRPLKIGIDKDVLEYLRTHETSMSGRRVRIGLADYCCKRVYREAVVEGAVRIDLDGNACGVVTADQAAGAARKLGPKGGSHEHE